MSLLIIVISVLLPPLAVFMKTGFSGKFLLNILLSLLGWIPGVIHALYVNRN
ncbi:MAG TPA: YqaE/Pmp3 family membrane protein [Dysgonamonadaceae bacterium]|nr:YqaE/Pmp3 family membrane protein [Dysgonamonadaceae bacterium]